MEEKLIQAILNISQYCYEQEGCKPSCVFYDNKVKCTLRQCSPVYWKMPKSLLTKIEDGVLIEGEENGTSQSDTIRD